MGNDIPQLGNLEDYEIKENLSIRSPIFDEEYQKRMEQAIQDMNPGTNETFFKKAWHFVKGKTEAGKIFHRTLGTIVPVVGAVFGIETAGLEQQILNVNGEPTMTPALIELFGFDIGLSEILLVVAALLSWALAYVSVKAREFGKQFVKIIKLAAKFLSKDSEEGKKLSDNEKDALWAEFIILIKIGWNLFGKKFITKKLFGLDKITEQEAKQLE